MSTELSLFNSGCACFAGLQVLTICDMQSTSIQTLLSVPVGQRGDAWESDFLRELPKASVRIVNDTAVAGPDGWPYLLLATDLAPGADAPVDADRIDSFVNVAQWIATRGLGLVLNPEKAMPDFVMTYGMVWNFRERGEFLTLPEKSAGEKSAGGPIEIRDGQQLHAGAPSLAYLPQDVRSVLREFLKRQRVFEPRVLMISTDNQITWDLAFSLESLGSPPASEHAGIAEAISWFLPAHYSVALINESSVPGFSAL